MLSDTERDTLADTLVAGLRAEGHFAKAHGDGAFAFDYDGFEISGAVQDDGSVSLLRYDDDGEPAADVDDVPCVVAAVIDAARTL